MARKKAGTSKQRYWIGKIKGYGQEEAGGREIKSKVTAGEHQEMTGVGEQICLSAPAVSQVSCATTWAHYSPI